MKYNVTELLSGWWEVWSDDGKGTIDCLARCQHRVDAELWAMEKREDYKSGHIEEDQND